MARNIMVNRIKAFLFTILLILSSACSTRPVQGGGNFPLPTYTDRPAPTQISRISPTAELPAGKEIACIPNNEHQGAKVVKVVDGDTINVEISGKEYTVRYIGMDTPETVKPNTPVQYYGPEASAKNKELVGGKTVILIKDVSETDKYDRLLRYVISDGKFVNFELVAQGYAHYHSYPPDISCNKTFASAERDARKKILGLWATPTPNPDS